MRRRDFIKVVAGSTITWPLAARAQQSGAIRRVGVLLALPDSDPEWLRRVNSLKRGLEELGWTDGRNVALVFRSSGNAQQLAAFAAEMAHANVDAIVLHSAPAIEAARTATKTIPIIIVSVGDAVGAGYVASLAHPGGNTTGQTLFATEQGGKRLELIKELSANLNRLGVLWNRNIASHQLQLKEMERAAVKLDVSLHSVTITAASEVDAGLRAVTETDDQAILTMEDAFITSQRSRIIDASMRHHLPVMGEFRLLTEAGGLMCYGPNLLNIWHHT